MQNRMHRGMTLAELLIVVAIAVLLLGTALPIMKSGAQDSKVREAARQVNTICMLAKARAAELDRPVGVWFQRQATLHDDACIQMFLAESPEPFGGHVVNARAYWDSANSKLTFGDTTSTSSGNVYVQKMVDTEAFGVKFNYRGKTWRFESSFQLSSGQVATIADFLSQVPGLGSTGLPYQLYRVPQRTTTSLELPDGTCVDMTYSGMGPGGAEFSAAFGAGTPIVLFSPQGSIMEFRGGFPDGTIHILIGETERVGFFDEPGDDGAWGLTGKDDDGNSTVDDAREAGYGDDIKGNLGNEANLWVSVNPRTGRITTTENAGATFNPTLSPGTNLTDSSPPGSAIANDLAGALREARKIALEAESMGSGG